MQGVQPTAPEALKVPLGHAAQSVFPPMEYVPAAHGSVPVFSVVGFDPAGAEEHELAAAEELYCPAPLQSVHDITPPSENVDAAHDSQVLLAFEANFPAPQYSHTLMPALLLTNPFESSQSEHDDDAAPEYFPI